MQNLNTGEDEKLLRLKQVLEVIPVSKSSWWAGVKDGKYPASVKKSYSADPSTRVALGSKALPLAIKKSLDLGIPN